MPVLQNANKCLLQKGEEMLSIKKRKEAKKEKRKGIIKAREKSRHAKPPLFLDFQTPNLISEKGHSGITVFNIDVLQHGHSRRQESSS